MKYFSPFIVLLWLLWSTAAAHAQTVGIGEVTSIESKAAAIKSSRTKIEKNKAELPALLALRNSRLLKLKDELAALYKERDALIADMKVGARCSQCGVWKSDFEKKGVNFQQHLGEVKGYAIPASTRELETTRNRFAEKIALKKVEIQNLEKTEDAYTAKQKEIATLEQGSEALCTQITNHSKNYETQLFADGKSKHESWTNDLLTLAIAILIADDKVTIYKAAALRLEKKFGAESAETRERVQKENEEKQAEKKNKIAANEKQIEARLLTKKEHLLPLETALQEKEAENYSIDQQLKQAGITDSTRLLLASRQTALTATISQLKAGIDDYSKSMASQIAVLKKENQQLNDEVFALQAGLAQQQQQEVAKLKVLFDQKIKAVKQSETEAIAGVAAAKKTYADRVVQYKQKNDRYLAEVIAEANRMLAAGQSVNCSVWNTVRGKIMTNWNQVFPCVNALTQMAKPYSTNVFNAYCAARSMPGYMTSYKNFLSGLAEEDRQAVKANSNADWYEQMSR